MCFKIFPNKSYSFTSSVGGGGRRLAQSATDGAESYWETDKHVGSSRWCADVAGSDREKCFCSAGWNWTKRNHNYYNSPRPIHSPLTLFTKPIVSTVALLLIQHYCYCVKPTVTDGNPAIIYCNSLCATKWKQLSQSTQRSVEQITTHNSLWVW